MGRLGYVILDLEWNGTYCRRLNGFINEIIEIGAVRVADDLTLEDTFTLVVRPQIGKKLSSKVQSLTNISQEELDSGAFFLRAMRQFQKFVGDSTVLTWGTSDILALMENQRYYTGSDRIPWLTQYLDLQDYCQKRMNYDTGKQMGLGTAAALLGIAQEGMEHHRALDDSLLALACLRHAGMDETLWASLVQDAGVSAFYDKMGFKTVILCDISHPRIHPWDMWFVCRRCGVRAIQKTEWELHNKAFRAQFTCGCCQDTFLGRVQFKLKYEGLFVRKKALPVPAPSEADAEKAISDNKTQVEKAE